MELQKKEFLTEHKIDMLANWIFKHACFLFLTCVCTCTCETLNSVCQTYVTVLSVGKLLNLESYSLLFFYYIEIFPVFFVYTFLCET